MGASCSVQGDKLVVPPSQQKHLWQISGSTQQLCYGSWVKGSSNNLRVLPRKSLSFLLLFFPPHTLARLLPVFLSLHGKCTMGAGGHLLQILDF